MKQDQFLHLFEGGEMAFKRFMAISSVIFSEDIFNDITEDAPCKLYTKLLTNVLAGTSPAFVTGRMNFTEGCDLAGFWLTLGKDTPLLAKVERWVFFLSPSSCAVERYSNAKGHPLKTPQQASL